MKIKLTKKQSIIIITITTLLLIIGLYFIFKTPKKPQHKIPFQYDDSQNYDQNLQRWKDQCDFKPGKYTAKEIRTKLGRKPTIIYSNSRYPWVEGIYGFQFRTSKNFDGYKSHLYYDYIPGLLIDSWYLKRNLSDKPGYLVGGLNNSNINCVGSSDDAFLRAEFQDYWDTTPPPQPPKNQPQTP